jgi:aromatic ring-opening dioxygenase catalytic subunit (LigB family)
MEWTWGAPDTWNKMAAWFRGLAGTIGQRPKAILVISGHWETPVLSVTGAANPPLIYDYYGFPTHTYELKYPAPGAPELAAEVAALLNKAGFACEIDPERGFDHGVFIPFKLIYPDADIPIVQLSLKTNLDPAEHLRIGHALAPLRREGVLIAGSGMSFHNIRGYGDPAFSAVSDRFDGWLTEAVTAPDLEAREGKLTQWEKAPEARVSHPREEHLLPLMVVAGAADTNRGTKIFSDRVMEMTVSGFRFG